MDWGFRVSHFSCGQMSSILPSLEYSPYRFVLPSPLGVAWTTEFFILLVLQNADPEHYFAELIPTLY